MSTQTAVVPTKDDAATPASVAPRTRPRIIRMLMLGIVLPVALLASGRVIYHMLTHEETDDAYVTGSIHTLSSRLAGVVDQILVQENTQVMAGQPIIKLDTRDLALECDKARVALQQAQSQLAQAEARVSDATSQDDLVRAGIKLARANVSRDEATVAKARLDFERAETLKTRDQLSAISQADYDTAKTTLATATAGLEATHASLEAAQAYIASIAAKKKATEAERDAAKAQVRAAEYALSFTELQLSYTTITAPSDGIISRKNVEVGNRVQPGQALFAVVDQEVWIQANFKETQLSHLHPGQAVEVTVDALPGHVLTGHIDSFAPASGAQFALLPPDNASGNFTKVVQRVPVKITFDPASLSGISQQVRPGLSAIVSIAVD
ncbi:HlyD family secretion protein [Verrucomicrobium sp. BvORR034]|uniref:HlyD family secretion protein n=1 Tax=Verrucomicrobium sp. BvORR034 TaxID=1396418 RepID=UPI000678F410|nr:HlyD family secretion protein [Verrucomicrobium sp. BvORR034]